MPKATPQSRLCKRKIGIESLGLVIAGSRGTLRFFSMMNSGRGLLDVASKAWPCSSAWTEQRFPKPLVAGSNPARATHPLLRVRQPCRFRHPDPTDSALSPFRHRYRDRYRTIIRLCGSGLRLRYRYRYRGPIRESRVWQQPRHCACRLPEL